jgi:hypothetical protein
MFTNVGFIWLIIITMIIVLLIMGVKIFSRIRPFHFLEHKATSIGLLFMGAITIIALIESLVMYVRFSHELNMSNFFFAFLVFASFACAYWTVLPDIYPERTPTSFSLSFYSLFFGVAVFFEILANILFYLSWIHP